MTIVINLVAGTPRTGLWCPYCLFPGGAEAMVYALSKSGLREIGPVRKCFDCDAPLMARPE